jgi:hypothetical protein
MERQVPKRVVEEPGEAPLDMRQRPRVREGAGAMLSPDAVPVRLSCAIGCLGQESSSCVGRSDRAIAADASGTRPRYSAAWRLFALARRAKVVS